MLALGFQATPHHWGYECDNEDELVMQGEHWAPDNGCRGRPLIQTRGKVLGGSSSINLCNYVRGHKAEYDSWGEPSWSYGALLPYFRRAEELRGPPATEDASQREVTPPTDGAMSDSQLPPSVIVERLRSAHAISTGFVQACRRWLGGAAEHAPSHALEPPSEGAALHWVTISDGMRVSNAKLLHDGPAKAARAEGRLRVETDCRVLKVLVEASPVEGTAGPGEAADEGAAATSAAPPRTRAVGVVVRDRRGQVLSVRAQREVILSAGAINTPQLLLLSGVGPRDELQSVGVTPTVHLPGVGKQLRDTAAVGVCARTGLPTLDKQLRRPWPYLRYLLTRDGPLGSNTLEASAWISARRLAAHMRGGSTVAEPEDPAWEQLRQRLDDAQKDDRGAADREGAMADGRAVAAFPRAARLEAAARLIGNHAVVLRDMTNGHPPPTQAHLQPVAAAASVHVDEMLREVVSRLLGGTAPHGPADAAEDAADASRRAAWADAATYLHGRIQVRADERPGRQPDMSEAAGAAMRAVLVEVGRLPAPTGAPAPPAAQEAPPAMQLLVQPLLFPFASWGKFKHLVEGLKAGTLPSATTVHVVLLRPESTGDVTLWSDSPLARPRIRNNYLSKTADLQRLVAGVRIARELLAGGDEMHPQGEILPGEAVTSHEELEHYVRANACHFNGSLCGSCHMGPASDPLAVVDASLRVRGIDGLRIVDASVMPTLVSGQLNATVTAIAERAASLIASEHAAGSTAGSVCAGDQAAPGDEQSGIRLRRQATSDGYRRL